MNDLFFARSQMGMSLAFHIVFTVIGMLFSLEGIAFFTEATLNLLLLALGAGAVVLLPSLFYLFQIFKGQEQR